MVYLFMLFMLGCGYYTLTYGVSLWKKDKNKLGGAAMVALAVIGTLVPAIVMILKA